MWCFSMQVSGESSRAPTMKHFAFNTTDFSNCFSSPEGDFMNKKIYTTLTHYEFGEFHYSAKHLEPKELVRCDIRVVVPKDKSMFFNITNASLPCSYGRIIIHKATNRKKGNRRLTYCNRNPVDRPQTSVHVLSPTAVATFILGRFSSDVIIQLHFSAVLRSADSPPGNSSWRSDQAVSSGKTCCHSTTSISYEVSCCRYFPHTLL